MKLGEALTLRSVQATKLAELRERIGRNALVQEGEEEIEKVDDLLTTYRELSEEHRILVQRIHEANVASGLLADLMEREHLRRLRAGLETAIRTAAPSGMSAFRYTRSEIKFHPTVDVVAKQKELDEVQESLRLLDASIQARNWQTDL